MTTKARPSPVSFAMANQLARRDLPSLLACWLPDGRRSGREWVARNPRRNDRHPGSFKINMITGAWADFAIGARGGDPVSLCAYLFDLSQSDAARMILNRWGR